VDNELDAAEFAADKDRKDGFVQPYDRWESLLRFDKNGDKRIGWFDADAYRQELRRKLLAAFAADKDGKLTDAERDRANRALATGWNGDEDLPRWARRTGDLDPNAAGPEGLLARRLNARDILRRYGKDGNVSEEERQAVFRKFEQDQRQEMLTKYDKNGDGVLDDEERAAMRADQRKQGQPWQQMAEKLAARLFEADSEGKLTEKGKAEAKEFQKQVQDLGKEYDLRMNDLDGDGTVSPEERKQMAGEWRKQALRLIGLGLKYMDTDGTGVITAEKRQAFADRLQKGVEKWADGFIKKYHPGEGSLTETERAALLKGLREEIDGRVKKWDPEGNGRITPKTAIQMMDEFAQEIGLKTARAAQPATPPSDEEE
jgi:Ca2+-binding EF-hand superfamily protein